MNKVGIPKKTSVVIIGGGATGTGIARDLSLRGIDVVLFEKKDLATGTTGRCHAMLHSGARYVAKDKEAATECAQENQILKRIAPHITQDCGGYFLGITDEECDYSERFVNACKSAKVPVFELSKRELLKKEPFVNPEIKKVFKVNDGYIDPFLLCYYNAMDANKNGAIIVTYTLVTDFIIENNQLVGIKYRDLIKNYTDVIKCDYVVSALGPWSGQFNNILRSLKIDVVPDIVPTMGTLIVLKDRIVNCVINRLQFPGDGDIIVPSHQSVLVGTSSKAVSLSELDNLLPPKKEVDRLLDLGAHLVPSLKNHRVIRFFAGARPLIASGDDLRSASRKFAIIDYENYGLSGLLMVFGGKMTTYRLMAEQVSNIVIKKLGTKSKCTTAIEPLPGGETPVFVKNFENSLHSSEKHSIEMTLKWGTFYSELSNLCANCLDHSIQMKKNAPKIICECEQVSESELNWVQNNMFPRIIDDYRRRTRQGMGPCQGQFCFYKIANFEAKTTEKTHEQIINELKYALEERWKPEPSADQSLKRQYKLAKYMYRMGGGI